MMDITASHLIRAILIASCLAMSAASAAQTTPVKSCAQLAETALPAATISSAEVVGAGKYVLPGNPPRSGMNLAGRIEAGANPAFCRIIARMKPGKESDIRMEVWLPQSGWNGKFIGVGNFGWGGVLMYAGMLAGIQEGYAVASNDTGHDASLPDQSGGKFALGPVDRMIDYGYRANHEMTVHAKNLVRAYYGAMPTHSYFIGCSLGGLQGLVEIKRYPEDYDGVVVGAPPNPIVNFNALQMWPSWLVAQDRQRLIPKEKYAMVHATVLRRCASPIGQQQGFVDAPESCNFDPKELLCKGAEAADCLTAPQVDLLQKTYQGPVNPRTGAVIFPGPARGTELEMFTFASGEAMSVALDMFRYAAFQNPDFNWKTMDWDKDVGAASARVGPLMHVDSNLKPFFERGGKLLFYIGWNDYHNPQELIGYYQAVLKNSGAKAGNAMRLFTIPGMGHCAGGNGCDTFNKIGEIDAWVDQGKSPERIVTSRVEAGKVVRTRPICAYPKVAKYRGNGDINDAASFNCEQ